MELDKLDLEQAKKYILELRNEAADRRKANEKLESDLKEIRESIENEKKTKEDSEAVKKGEYERLLAEKESKIKELTAIKKDNEAKLNTYAEQEQKEIQALKDRLPDNLKENFANNNNKLELSAIVTLLDSKKQDNSVLGEMDSILNAAKTGGKLTREQEATWAEKDPASYQEHIRNQIRGSLPFANIK